MSEGRTSSGAAAEPGLVGRDRELAVLLETLQEHGPRVAFVDGVAGIGKSTLLADFAGRAVSCGARIATVDAATVEPTADGVVRSVAGSAGIEASTVEELAAAIPDGAPYLVCVDTYERLRVVDDWFRLSFVAGLPERVRVVVAGREPPMAEWTLGRVAGGVRRVSLGPLPPDDAIAVLAGGGLGDAEARRVNAVLRGHPLALRVAVLALRDRPELVASEAAIPSAVDELTRLFTDGLDAPLRRVLDAVSVVRRATVGLLEAMIAGLDGRAALDEVARLPVAEVGSDGLRLHESVQGAIAARLLAVDPVAVRHYRTAAFTHLVDAAASARPADPWRYTADLLYLLQNEAVREAFFPTTAHMFTVEPARPHDRDAVEAVVARHDPAAGGMIGLWWNDSREAVRVARDRSGAVVGVSVVGAASMMTGSLLRADPVAAAWRAHEREQPLPRTQHSLVHRWCLDAEVGERPSPVQAACWLDIKRLYMEGRPAVGRLYSVAADPTPYLEAMDTLGFRSFGTARIGEAEYQLALLDFGTESIDGWIADLVAAELGVERPDWLDADGRSLRIGAAAVSLTPLEFGVLVALRERGGRVAGRAELIAEVWGDRYDATSNVVDVVVRSLRRKLGPKSGWLQTVRGAGYRLVVS